jgi:hypothetical protein
MSSRTRQLLQPAPLQQQQQHIEVAGKLHL